MSKKPIIEYGIEDEVMKNNPNAKPMKQKKVQSVKEKKPKQGVMAYSEKQKTDIINDICERVSKGEALRNILNEKSMPDRTTFYRWIDSDEEKSKQYARATTERADTIFEEMITIADDQEGDIIIVDGKEKTNHNVVNRSRLRIDTRKWILSKMNPKKYGDKMDITSDGDKIANGNVIINSKGEKPEIS